MKYGTAKIPYNLLFERRRRRRVLLLNTIKTAAVTMLTIAVSEFLHRMSFDKATLTMIHTLAILIVSRITSGYASGIIASIIITVAYDYFITDPRMAFSVTIGFPITLCVMLVVTLSTSTLTNQMKKQTLLAQEREQRVKILYEINERFLAARNLDSIVRVTNEYLVSNIKRSVIFYTGDPFADGEGVILECPDDRFGAHLFLSEHERNTVHNIFAKPLSVDILSQSSVNVFYIPVVSISKVLGVIGVSCADNPLSKSGVQFLNTLALQVASALEIQNLAAEQKTILIDAKRERSRAILLRAISHDLRTPLTSILGASSAIIDQGAALDESIQFKLITEINENAGWLIRIVENLLSVTKVFNGAMTLSKMDEAVEEVVAQAVSIVRKNYPGCRICINGPEELLLIPMEATLISQVIINLLENAINYSDSGSQIDITVTKHFSVVEISISDYGHGVPEQILGSLFESDFSDYDNVADSIRGTGIGLSICKTIIDAHGGTITGMNKEGGGAYFCFTLPMDRE